MSSTLLERSRAKLEFPEIISSLTQKAISQEGKKLCNQLLPTSDIDEARKWLEETEDALEILYKRGEVPLQGMHKIRPAVIKSEMPGAILSSKDLLQIASFLQAVERLYNFIPSLREDEHALENSYYRLLHGLLLHEKLQMDISKAIIGENEIADSASPELQRLRKNRAKSQEQIRRILDKMLKQHGEDLQDNIITLRQDRYVIPVKISARSSVPGIVHDSSQSGQTLFVEPIAVVEENNKIREIKLLEEREIQRILQAFTKRVGEHKEEILHDIEILAQADFTMAKAKLAKQMRARKPELNADGIISLKQARHPHIPDEEVVPIDIYVGKDFHTLLITGPNTGGKTVSLKTVGLLSIMAMSGLEVPCDGPAILSMFDKILVDIGDEQSIEQSLSTFSSHMRNIVEISELVDDRSLVLTDELGSGTDPSEGAALAIAILEDFKQAGAITVATTHYKELKIYALETDGVENASCEFDSDSLKPTYRILIGVPGTSHAFVISRKLGLREGIIKRAQVELSNEDIQFEQVLAKVEEMQRESAALLEQARLDEKRWREARTTVELQEDEIRKSKSQILQDAREETRRKLKEQERQVDAMLKELSKNQSVSTMEEAGALRQILRSELNAIEQEIGKETLAQLKKGRGRKTKDSWDIGDVVYVPALGIEARIESAVDNKGKVLIKSGQMQVEVDASTLQDRNDNAENTSKKDKKTSSRGQSTGKIVSAARMHFRGELKIIGSTVDEGLNQLDAYLDEATLAGAESVRIVHGKGTGALRNGVREFLRQDRRVKSYRQAAFGEGDAGVTIAELV